MRFQQRHYVAIAAVIKATLEYKQHLNEMGEHNGASDLACNLADAFAADNPRFSRARFFAACGIREEG